ncbi:MAG: CBS domain-containing protein [Candidatus Riflebacteria bacterium]|nr:CBS domain-containing protein [Candidatus Riflebacteria bacterium]
MSFTLEEIMVPNPVTLRPEQSAFSARELMLLDGHDCLYVVDKAGCPVGVVTDVQAGGEEGNPKVAKLMSTEFSTVPKDGNAQDAARIFARKGFPHSAVPVVDGSGKLVGIVRLRDVVKDLATTLPGLPQMTPEALVVQLAMTHSEADEREWSRRVRELGYASAVTQVGTTAEKLPVKLRESSVVAGIAHGVITEDPREKTALSNAIRDVVLQMDVVSPGLGGGFKVGIIRGEGRISVAACGRSGHALASSQELLFLGSSTI